MKSALWIATLATMLALLIGCGGGDRDTTSPQPLREVKVTLDGLPGPQNVGFLMAERLGYFLDENLLVDLLTPLNPGRPIEYVTNRSVDLSVSHLPQIVLAEEKGAPIVAVDSVIPEPTASIIWLKKSEIDSVSDLKGKTIAVPGLPFQKDLLEGILGDAGMSLEDVKLQVVRYELVPALVSGRADAIFGGSGNLEGAELESRGLDPVVVPVRDLGVPGYEELVVFARRDRLASDPESIRNFISALARGTAAAIEDPAKAAEVVADKDYLDQRAARAAVESTLPLLSESGHLDEDKAARLVDWMHDEGMIQDTPPVSSLLSNDYLPISER